MDIYAHVGDFLLNMPIAQAWPEARRVVERAAAQRDRNWLLPALVCEAAGGSAAQAVPAVAAIGCAQIAIILIDDMLDSDPRGEHNRIGMAAAANLAAAFQAAALEAVARSSAPQAVRCEAANSLNRMAAATCFGQHLDTQNPVSEEDYWRVVEMKSAPFFASAFHVGALFGGASAEAAGQLKALGGLYGELVQIYDDLHDTLASPASTDWTLGRAPLPILFAQTVEHRDRVRFAELRRLAAEPAALAEAQEILIRCGAVSYGVHELTCRWEKARALADSIPLPQRKGLASLLDELIAPVNDLLAKMN